MAKKKVKKKSASSKRVTNKNYVKENKEATPKKIIVTPNKIRIVVKNLIMFILLSVLFLILSLVSENKTYADFFNLLSWILGFISIAFLLTLLILLFLKAFRKN